MKPSSRAAVFRTAIFVLSLLLPVAELLLRWTALPAELATHFGPSGYADDWMGRGVFALTWGALCVLCAGLFYALPPMLGWSMSHRPAVITLPPPLKAKAIQDPYVRAQVVGIVTRYTITLSVLTTALLTLAIHAVLKANLDGTERLDGALIWPPLALVLLWSIGGGVWLTRRLRRLV